MNYKETNIIQLVHKCKNIILDEEKTASITQKGNADFVTKVDFSVQDFLKEQLLKLYPNTCFMSEEQADNDTSFIKPTWILDPIDGTTNLIHHYQHSAVSLALCENGAIILGVVYNPFTEETFFAALGKGAYLNNKPIHVTNEADISKALITMGTSPYNKDLADIEFDLFKKVFMQCTDIRISGSAALDISYIACGRLECYFERILKPWDYAAASLILKEAGGTITCFDNSNIKFNKNCNILASNNYIHNTIQKLL